MMFQDFFKDVTHVTVDNNYTNTIVGRECNVMCTLNAILKIHLFLH